MDRISDATRFWIESDVAEQFERARGQIAASWIENRVVVRERHVFEPRGRDIFIKRRPPAVATLKTQLPIERAPKSTFQRSEERRVGKEDKSRRETDKQKTAYEIGQ